MHKSGFVSIIGRPNVGKSTLLNAILGKKISIISSTSQTTRNSIKGIYSKEDCQIIFIDTPGIHKAKNSLGEFMNKESLNSLKETDAILWLVSSSDDYGSGDEYVKNFLRNIDVPLIICFNKIDLITDNEKYIENKNKFLNDINTSGVYEISSLNNQNIDLLLDGIKNVLEEGPKYYDENILTDSFERFIVSELIREKVFYLTKDEIPHSVAVEIEEMRENESETEIYAVIICERESQKRILIGSSGQMVKKIKDSAKRDIKKLLGCKIYLELFVKVDSDWRNNKASLARLGYKSSR